jgi:hypothetical protein
MLHALFVSTFITAAVLPALHSLAILKVVLPVAFVLGSIDVNVDAEAIGFIIFPLTFIDVTVSVPEFSTPVCLVFAPFALVFGVIWPNLDSWAVTHLVMEVTFVNSTILESELLNKGKTLLLSVLLKVEQILVIGVKKMRDTARSPSLFHLRSRVAFGEGAVPIVVYLSLAVLNFLRLFNFDFSILFGWIDASASVAHFSKLIYLLK